jgi:hypothetical protein
MGESSCKRQTANGRAAILPKRVSRLLGQAKTGLEKAYWAANSCYFYLFQAQAYAVGRWAASATTHMPVPMVK